MSDDPAAFWGKRAFVDQQTASIQLGALDLRIWCRPFEWRLAIDHDPDPHTDRTSYVTPAGPFEPPPSARIERFATRADTYHLTLEPHLPDGDVVVRPDQPITVLPGAVVALYVGMPLWIRLVTDDGVTVTELSTVPMSRTWFGPNTQIGQLCWAQRTRARMTASEMPKRSNRTVTVVTLRNDDDAPLVVERVNVPATLLALYRSADGAYFSQGVTVIRPPRGESAVVQIDAGAPPIAGRVTQVAPARRVGVANAWVRAFGALLG